MRRREFIAGLGGAVWPFLARAQQTAMPVIGVLHSASPDGFFAQYVAEFRRGLAGAAYVEGRNVAIEYRFAEGQYDRLPALATDLARRQMAAIFATGTAASLVARAATATIPIIFSIGGDPVRFGLVASFNRPGGNVTGISQLSNVLYSKQIGLLHEMMPTTATIALIVNPNNPNAASDISDAKMAAQTVGQQIIIFERQHRTRHRHSICEPTAGAGRRAPRRKRCILVRPARSASRTGGTLCDFVNV